VTFLGPVSTWGSVRGEAPALAPALAPAWFQPRPESAVARPSTVIRALNRELVFPRLDRAAGFLAGHVIEAVERAGGEEPPLDDIAAVLQRVLLLRRHRRQARLGFVGSDIRV